MASRLLQAGHTLTVWNRDANKAAPLVAQGARLAPTPRAAAEDAEVVIAMLRDDDVSRQVWTDAENGALSGLQPGCVAVECSTLTPAWVCQLAAQLQARGAGWVDAPVAGSRPQAEAGQLIFLAGGATDDIAALTPLLLTMGSAVHHAGPVGAGAVLKLAVNALLGVQAAAVAELFGLLQRHGLDVARASEILAQTPVISPAMKAASTNMLAGNFAPLFPTGLMEKDLGYVLASSKGQLPLVAACHAVLVQAMQQGYATDNYTSLIRLYDRA
jgi:3-hydroxyisobutyrate dehydrogenase